MSETTTTPRKRTYTNEEDLPTFDDPVDMVNAVISVLQKPEEKTNVAIRYANDKNLATEVQAYAKIAGQDWTYYVKSLKIPIGRNTDNGLGPQSLVDIDLGPAKVVSRQHAIITYNLDLRYWELKVLGRNGAKVDGQKVPFGSDHSTPLHSGAILDIGGTQMMFILPDSLPNILGKMLNTLLTRYKENLRLSKRKSFSYTQQNIAPINQSNQIKSFQMFDRAQITQSPSSASASSLQNNLDQDLSKEESKDIKPPYSYATMITQAILSNPEGVMSLSEIYNWISSHYAYYKYSKTGWQNSIRHNLSLNKAFEKVPRRPNEPGKGMKWQISESYKEDFLNKIQNGSLQKARRGSSVSRQLQLHLATHQNLPEPLKYYTKTDSARNMNEIKSTNNRAGLLGYAQQATNSLQSNTMYPGNQQQQNGTFNMASRYGFQLQHPQLIYGSQPGLSHTDAPPLHLSQVKNEFSSPVQAFNDKGTPRLSRVAGAPLYNLSAPPHTAQSSSILTNLSQSPQNTYSQSQTTEISNLHSLGKNSLNPGTSDSATTNPVSNNVSSVQTSNTSEVTLGFTSPKKIAPLEAFTPERGSKSTGTKPSIPNGLNTNQSSPAFWNFVQFSTPNPQSPTAKCGDQNQLSPTMNRKLLRENGLKPPRTDLSPLGPRILSNTAVNGEKTGNSFEGPQETS